LYPRIFKDQLGREIVLHHKPERIISLVPSQTELLFDLELNNEVIGITKFCVHPEEWFRTKVRVGGTKKVDFSKVKALQPDLIIANKEENTQAEILNLMQHFPVWVSDIITLDDSLNMIRSVGDITETDEHAEKIISKVKHQFNNLKIDSAKELKTIYLIWKDPYMGAGDNTFIHEMLNCCGFTNLLKGRYPEINESIIKELQPELILLSSEPYPFKEKHISSLQQLLPDSMIKLVDGEMFSWYGSRLQHAPAYFKTLVTGFAI